jgi:multidrug efflux pump subunit AcrA (membrane-fusion protein)
MSTSTTYVAPGPPQRPAKKPHTARKVVLIVLGAVLVLIILIASLGGSKSNSAASKPAPAVTHSQVAKSAPVKTLSAAQLAAQKAAAAKAAAAAKVAQAKAAAAAKVAAAAAAKASAQAAAQAAAAAAAKTATENTPISATQWGNVLRNPAAYVGDIYTISGTVAEYNINSNTFATVANAALVATDSNGNQFVVEGDSSVLGNAQSGDNFTAKVTVVGVAQTQSTVGGGTGQIPDFDASTFTDTGSGS